MGITYHLHPGTVRTGQHTAAMVRKAVRALAAVEALIERLRFDPAVPEVTDRHTGWRFFSEALAAGGREAECWWEAIGLEHDLLHRSLDCGTRFATTRPMIRAMIDAEAQRHAEAAEQGDPFAGLF